MGRKRRSRVLDERADGPGTRARDSYSLEEELLDSARAMLRHALFSGLSVPPETIRAVSAAEARLAAQGSTAGEAPSSPDLDPSQPLLDLVAAHEELCKVVAPARPQALLLIEREKAATRLFGPLGPVRLARELAGAALLFLALFIATSLSPALDVGGADVFDHTGWSLLVNEAFFLAAAGVGATFAGLFHLNGYVTAGTYDPKYDSSYWIRIVLGLVAGMVLAALIPVEGSFSKPLLALLGGFAAPMVQRRLTRLAKKLDSDSDSESESPADRSPDGAATPQPLEEDESTPAGPPDVIDLTDAPAAGGGAAAVAAAVGGAGAGAVLGGTASAPADPGSRTISEKLQSAIDSVVKGEHDDLLKSAFGPREGEAGAASASGGTGGGSESSGPAQPASGSGSSASGGSGGGSGSGGPAQAQGGSGAGGPAQAQGGSGAGGPAQPASGSGSSGPAQPASGSGSSGPAQAQGGSGSGGPAQPASGSGAGGPAQAQGGSGAGGPAQPSAGTTSGPGSASGRTPFLARHSSGSGGRGDGARARTSGAFARGVLTGAAVGAAALLGLARSSPPANEIADRILGAVASPSPTATNGGTPACPTPHHRSRCAPFPPLPLPGPTVTVTATPSPEPTVTATPTATPSPEPTVTATPTATPEPEATVTISVTEMPRPRPTVTVTVGETVIVPRPGPTETIIVPRPGPTVTVTPPPVIIHERDCPPFDDWDDEDEGHGRGHGED